MGDGIIFLNNYRVFRGVLKGDGVIFTRRQIDFLGIGLLDGVAGGGFQLFYLVPARFLPLQVNFPLGVGVEGAQVVVFAGLGIVRPAPDLELHALNGTAGDGIHLFNEQIGLSQVAQFQGGGLVFLQIDGVDGIIGHPAILGFDLLDGISARVQPLQHDQALGVGEVLLVIAAVDLRDAEQDAGEGFAGLLVDFQQAQTGLGAVHKVHHHVLVLGGVDPDGFAIVGVQQVGSGHVRFLNFIAPAGHIGEGGLTVRARHYVVLIAQVDSTNVEAGVGDGFAGLSVPLGNRQAALVMVHFFHHNGLLSLQILGVDVDAHRGTVTVETSRGGHLHKFIMALGDVADGNRTIRAGFLGGDDLAVPQDDKNSASQGAAALIHLFQHDFDLAGIFKNQRDIMLPIPHEGLLHLGHVGAEDEALWGRDLLRNVAAGGELRKVQVLFGDVAAIAGGVFADKAAAVIQLDRSNADNRPRDAHGGIVRIHFADRTVALCFVGLVVKNECAVGGAVGHHGHDLGSGLGHIALRCGFLSDFILTSRQSVRLGGQDKGSVRACGFGDGKIAGTVRALHLKGHTGDRLVGARFQLFYGEAHGALGGLIIRHSNEQTLHRNPRLARQLPGLGFIPIVHPQVIGVEILGVVQHRVYPGSHIIISGVAGFAAVGAVDNAVSSDFAPICDETGLAVGLMVQLHCRHELLRSLLNKALPVAVHIQDDTVLIVPGHRLGHQEPDVGPILIPMLQAHSITRVGVVAVGVGINIGQKNIQRGVVYLLFEVPFLAVGPRPQGPLLIGAQGAGGTIAGDLHLLIEYIGQAHIVDDAACRPVADGLAADLHVVRGLLRDTGRGRGQARGGEGRQRQNAHNAHQSQQKGRNTVDNTLFQSLTSLKRGQGQAIKQFGRAKLF